MKLLYVLCLVFLTACGAKGNSTAMTCGRNNNMIVANNDEVPFDRQYGLSIKLPMPENKFLQLLNRLHLNYNVSGDPAKGLAIPKPRLCEDLKEINVARVYQVYGGIDGKNRFGRVYRIFVNKAGEVVYIENAFEYPGT